MGTRGENVSKKTALRLASLIMFIIAVIFVFCALSCPTLGRTFYVFGIAIGAEVWRAFYAIYALVMCSLFIGSFFCKKANGGKR